MNSATLILDKAFYIHRELAARTVRVQFMKEFIHELKKSGLEVRRSSLIAKLPVAMDNIWKRFRADLIAWEKKVIIRD